MGACLSHPSKFEEIYDDLDALFYTFRVDHSTQFWIKLCNIQIKTAVKNPTAELVGPPKEPKMVLNLQPGKVRGFDMAVRFTDLDEDTGDQDGTLAGLVQGAMFLKLKKLKIGESELDFFPSAEHGYRVGQEILGEALPPSIEPWTDLLTDKAMSLLAFYGLGQVYLTKVRNPLVVGVNGASYEVDLSFLHKYGVREKFEKYGCIAVFDKDKEILGIYWCHHAKFVTPKDADWEHVKLVFKSTLITAITIKDHLVHVHWINSNNLLFASRQSFSEDHPIRRLLKIHTYRAATINWASKTVLLPKYALAFRVFAVNEEDWYRCVHDCVHACKYQTFDDMIQEKELPPELQESMPYLKDGRDLQAVIRKYVTDYLSFYYADDAAVLADHDIQMYWKHYEELPLWPSYNLPSLSKTTLIEQITHSIFAVTGMHEFVGSVVEYLLNPTGLPSKIVPDKAEADVQSFFQALCLIALTGLRQPALINDWSEVILHDRMSDSERNVIAAVMRTFQEDLKALGQTIIERNKSREKPFMAMNPLNLECSVSI